MPGPSETHVSEKQRKSTEARREKRNLGESSAWEKGAKSRFFVLFCFLDAFVGASSAMSVSCRLQTAKVRSGGVAGKQVTAEKFKRYKRRKCRSVQKYIVR